MPHFSVNPATGQVLKAFIEHTDQEMINALAKADNAFVSWTARPIEERAKIMARAAELLLEQKNELAKLATLGMGKRIAESRGEVELSAAILQYCADCAPTHLAPKLIKSAMGDVHLEFSPLGVLLSVQPWNYPYYQLSRSVGPHLMSGNVMLLSIPRRNWNVHRSDSVGVGKIVGSHFDRHPPVRAGAKIDHVTPR